MKRLYQRVINNPVPFTLFAILLFVLYQTLHGPVAEVLGVCSGLLLGTLAHHHWMTAHVEEERRRERTTVIEQIAEFKRLGLHEITPERDPSGFGFFERVEHLRPAARLAILGVTARYPVEHRLDQLRQMLTTKPTLRMQVCVLSKCSPFAEARAREVNVDTRENIQKSLIAWTNLARDFPKRLEIRVSNATPYVEFEGYDVDLDKGKDIGPSYIYLIPIPYKAHTNQVPSLLLVGPQTPLYRFWAARMLSIWGDARAL